jgi:hypothetical protein
MYIINKNIHFFEATIYIRVCARKLFLGVFFQKDTVGEFIFNPLPAESIARMRSDASGQTVLP